MLSSNEFIDITVIQFDCKFLVKVVKLTFLQSLVVNFSLMHDSINATRMREGTTNKPTYCMFCTRMHEHMCTRACVGVQLIHYR